jgi:hypothetical protein
VGSLTRFDAVCTCDGQQVNVCHDIGNEPHLVGCPRWGAPNDGEPCWSCGELVPRKLLAIHMARHVLDSPYQPNPPLPPEVELLLDDFRKRGDLLASLRDIVNRWADRDDVTEQTAQLIAELLLSLHAGGYR